MAAAPWYVVEVFTGQECPLAKHANGVADPGKPRRLLKPVPRVASHRCPIDRWARSFRGRTSLDSLDLWAKL